MSEYEVYATMRFRYRVEAESEQEARDSVEEGGAEEGELFSGPDVTDIREIHCD
jgi:hypothetical protein